MFLLLQIISNNNTVQVLLDVGIAIVTIFIPIGISLSESINDNKFTINKAVIFDCLISGKELLYELSLLFFPLLFWSTHSILLKTLGVILWGIGFYFIIVRLKKIYGWLRGNRYNYYIKYLEESTIDNSSQDLWQSIWKTSNVDRQIAKQFIQIFQEKIDWAFIEDDRSILELLPNLILDFKDLTSKQEILFLTSRGDIFEKVLDWHYLSWKQEYSNNNVGSVNNDSEKFLAYHSITNVLNQIFKEIIERSLLSSFTFGFFELIKEHINERREDKITKKENDYYYLTAFLSVFYLKFFDLIGKAYEKDVIWKDYLPDYLKISTATITNKPAQITFDCYKEWSLNIIKYDAKGLRNYDLEEITNEIFPDFSRLESFPKEEEGKYKAGILDHFKRVKKYLQDDPASLIAK